MSNLEELNNRRVEMLSGGGEAQIKKQHDKGK
jgi:acetyl-CoA carboxylase carboxyltransferase component